MVVHTLFGLHDIFMKEDIHLEVQQYDEPMLPKLFRRYVLSRHWCSTRDMRKNKETPCDLQCEWLYLNKVHICFYKQECQNNIHKRPGVTPDPLPSWLTILPVDIWQQYAPGCHLTACKMAIHRHREREKNDLFLLQSISESNKTSNFGPP